MVDKVVKSESEWKAQLSSEQFKVTRKKGTERAFSGKYWDNHAKAYTRCVCCGTPLFALGHEVRLGHRLAVVLGAGRSGQRPRGVGQHAVHAPHRSGVRGVRRASRSRLSRRSRTDWAALLHELGSAGFQARRIAGRGGDRSASADCGHALRRISSGSHARRRGNGDMASPLRSGQWQPSHCSRPGTVFAQSIHCESRDYRRSYCPTGRITGAQIISQTSNAACIQGRCWGWDGNGIWVNSGCAGDFAFQGGWAPPRPGPPIGTNSIQCESRDYQQNFCGTGVQDLPRVGRAAAVEAPCIQGRSWGWDQRGIWVSQGCSAVFSFAAGGGPPPPPMGSSIAVREPQLSAELVQHRPPRRPRVGGRAALAIALHPGADLGLARRRDLGERRLRRHLRLRLAVAGALRLRASRFASAADSPAVVAARRENSTPESARLRRSPRAARNAASDTCAIRRDSRRRRARCATRRPSGTGRRGPACRAP